MSQTRIMSIHRLRVRLFSVFCGVKALNGNVKHFVFDLTCEVTGDPGVKFFDFIWKILSRSLHCGLNFSATSIGYRDRWGRYAPPPPPQQRAGAGLGPAGCGLIVLHSPFYVGMLYRHNEAVCKKWRRFLTAKIEINGFIMHTIYDRLNLTSFLVISDLNNFCFSIRRAYNYLFD